MSNCEYCKQPASFIFKNNISCCSKNISGCPEIKRKRKAKCLEKYGVENISQVPSIKEAKNKTFQHNFQDTQKRTQLANNRRDTWLSNDVAAIVKKSKDTTTKIYGVDNILKVPAVASSVSSKNKLNASVRLAKTRQTLLSKYGVENASQVSAFFEKQQRPKWKDYFLPSGKTIKIQGFEDKALDILLETFLEENITTERNKLPTIWYNHANKQRRYYPDLMLTTTNTIIEVKSEYTYQKDLEVNLKKKDACLKEGYNFEFWIFTKGTHLRKEICKCQ